MIARAQRPDSPGFFPASQEAARRASSFEAIRRRLPPGFGGQTQAALTTSDAQGAFALDADGPVWLLAASTDLVAPAPALASPGQGAVVKLAARPRIAGRALDARGKPITALRINEVLTAAPGGRFDVPMPADLPTSVRLWASGYAPVLREVPSGGAGDLGDVTFPDAFTIAGRVEDASGRPVKALLLFYFGALKPASDGSIGTDDQGRFEFKEGAAGPVVVVARELTRGELAPAQVAVKPGAPPLRLRLSRHAALEVTALDARTGRPVQGAQIAADGPEKVGEPGAEHRTGTSDARGRWVAERATPGLWSVKVRDPSGQEKQQAVRVAPGKDAAVEVRLSTSAP
jgi:hypothetical protein